MAAEAECADVREVAFAAAFRDRKDVVGVPQGGALVGIEPPLRPPPDAPRSAQALQPPPLDDAVQTAGRAHAAIACKDLIAKICWVGAEPPFIHTETGT